MKARLTHARLFVMATGFRVAVTLIMLVIVRPFRFAVVYGSPDYEENALVAALSLARRRAHRVVLVCSSPNRARRYLDVVARELGLAGVPENVRVIRRSVLRSVFLLGSADVALFSSPLFSSPRPRGRRLHVNLWHGIGPKSTNIGGFSLNIGSPYLAGPARTWMGPTADGLGMRDPFYLTGNARQDLLKVNGVGPDLEALGLSKERPYVVWMPTFRRSQETAIGRFEDGRPLSAAMTDFAFEDILASAAAARGVDIVVKPHPLDAEEFTRSGFRVVTTEQIYDAGCSLHGFLGRAAGLISDYSSVWVDFLQTGKTVGLYCPDIEEYSTSRGLNQPSMADIARKLFLTCSGDVERLLDCISTGAIFEEGELRAVGAALEYVWCENRAETMLDELAASASTRFFGYNFGLTG